MMKAYALVALCLIGAAQLATAQTPAASWCCADEAEKTACEIVAAAAASDVTITCTIKADCEAALEAKTVDVMSNVDGAGIFDMYRAFGAEVIVGETYDTTQNETLSYYSTAVIRASDCTSGTITKLSDLEGKRSCHTGYGKSAGWKFPMSRLLSSGVMDLVVSEDPAKANDIATAEAFFDSACAPMKDAASAELTKDTLCKNCGTAYGSEGFCCRGDKSACPGSDLYYGYDGAMRCLVEGNGDVAFVKHVTVERNVDGGDNWADAEGWNWPSNLPALSSSFKLLCPNSDTCMAPEDYESCTLSNVPSHAVLARAGLSTDVKTALKNGITKCNNDAASISYFFSGTNSDGHIFKSSTKAVIAVDVPTASFLGSSQSIYDKINLMNLATAATISEAQAAKDDDQDDEINTLIIIVSIVGAVVVVLAIGMAFLISREKSGNPVFAKLAGDL